MRTTQSTESAQETKRKRSKPKVTPPIAVQPPHEIERELRDHAPRRVRVTRATQTWRWVAYNLVAISLAVALFFCVRDMRQMEALQTRGGQAEATVTNKIIKRGKNASVHLEYTFKARDAAEVSSQSRVSRSLWASEPGDIISVTYLPEDPTINCVGAVDQKLVARRRTGWGIAIGVGVLFATVISLCCELTLRNKLYLLRNGLPTTGTGTNRQVVPGKNTTYYIEYSYFMPSGAEKVNRVAVSQEQHDYYEPGKTFTVLMHPKNTTKSLPYFMMTALEVEGTPPNRYPWIKANH